MEITGYHIDSSLPTPQLARLQVILKRASAEENIYMETVFKLSYKIGKSIKKKKIQ